MTKFILFPVFKTLKLCEHVSSIIFIQQHRVFVSGRWNRLNSYSATFLSFTSIMYVRDENLCNARFLSQRKEKSFFTRWYESHAISHSACLMLRFHDPVHLSLVFAIAYFDGVSTRDLYLRSRERVMHSNGFSKVIRTFNLESLVLWVNDGSAKRN